MNDELSEYQVKVVAMSKDSVADAAAHKTRDDLSLQLLSDLNLKVIQQYGLEHHKAIEFSTVRFTILGLPLALVPTIKKMAIPTTLLIDEHSIIRWIDQADDYRIRSSEERIMEALRATFTKQSATKQSATKQRADRSSNT